MTLRDLVPQMEARDKALGRVRRPQTQAAARRHVEDLINNLEFRKQALLVYYFAHTEGSTSPATIEALEKLIEDYDLSFTSIGLIWDILTKGKPEFNSVSSADVCSIEHGWLKLISARPAKKVHDAFELISAMKVRAYPVSIAIAASASRNNVIEFIKKNWPEIEAAQRQTVPKPTRTRTRPRAKRDELILKRSRSSAQAIRGEIKRAGGKVILADEAIYSAKKKLRKRFRRAKIK